MADEKLRSYRRHFEKPWELEPELSEHRSAMTTEALHSKAEIAEEFAVRERKIAALEARAEKAERERDEARDQRDLAQCDVVLSNAEIAYARDLQYSARIRELEARAEKAEQEHEDTVPARIHEELRQVMLGERRRAEKAERERDAARNSKNDAIFGIHHGHANDLADALGCVNEHEGARQQPPWAEMIGMVERIRRERDEALSADYHCPQCGETLVTLDRTDLTIERDAALARVRELEESFADISRQSFNTAIQRDNALDRVRELEAKLAESESNSAWLDRAQKLSEQLDAITTGADKSDAEELAALRWLMGWLREKYRSGEEYSLAACDSGIGIFFTGNILVVKESTPVALATALDPNWRKAGSKED